MKASVDTNTCIGCELCTTICPDVFRMEEDGFAHTIVSKILPRQEDCAREAAESCPVDAISIVD